MIIIYHNNSKVIALSNAGSYSIDNAKNLTIVEFLLLLAKEYQNDLLVWCHINLKEQLDISAIEKLFHHKRLLLSYNPSKTNFIDKRIGYVDESIFINVNKTVSYPTWQMSSMVGGIYGSSLVTLKNENIHEKDFDYFLCSLAKLAMPKGLLCYSEPKLLKQIEVYKAKKASIWTLFRFVKQHYKTQWVFLLMLNLMIYERKFTFLHLLFSMFYWKRNSNHINIEEIKIQSTKKVVEKGTIDVIIPTIGRKDYLYDVICDLRNQTHLPKTVIIVEQNPNHESVSELNFLTTEIWPFNIKHQFIHQTGACNARNLALQQVDSEWVFLADDDNRLANDVIEKVFYYFEKYGVEVITTKYIQKNESSTYNSVISWSTFGAGNSFIHSNLLNKVSFNSAFEFGYGEDADFGMQLRNKGMDVLYLPEPEILHLKAPMGGFRTKPVLQWQNDSIQPKPSPTVMLYQILHNTDEQLLGYKTILFFKYYKYQKIKNPIKYFINFRKQWKSSVYWAHELNKK